MTSPQPVAPRPPRRQSLRLARTVAGLVVLAAAISFVVQNTRRVPVRLWWYTGHPELVWVAVGSLVIGAAVGLAVGRAGRRRRAAKADSRGRRVLRRWTSREEG